MSTAHLPFQKRLKVIGRKHDRMARNGVVHSVNHDGLIIARARRTKPRFPFKGLALLVLATILFKSLMLFQAGSIAYNERLDLLRGGNVAEAAGAWIMQIDPVTQWVTDQIRINVL
ncbi:hypothetical protein [Thalassobium sp. R2A62]|jgi:hypothetical protein|uniref:hypothetical protein n=1 Tax=Thalassobium sp. R2A62 TaxID=633131 RepID=UPI0002FFCE0C|nr:hypothetical protein [Thalassobium sp. R2A62]MDG2453221.1 hypothetical protein [Paracoccaceae bacterium]